MAAPVLGLVTEQLHPVLRAGGSRIAIRGSDSVTQRVEDLDPRSHQATRRAEDLDPRVAATRPTRCRPRQGRGSLLAESGSRDPRVRTSTDGSNRASHGSETSTLGSTPAHGLEDLRPTGSEPPTHWFDQNLETVSSDETLSGCLDSSLFQLSTPRRCNYAASSDPTASRNRPAIELSCPLPTQPTIPRHRCATSRLATQLCGRGVAMGRELRLSHLAKLSGSDPNDAASSGERVWRVAHYEAPLRHSPRARPDLARAPPLPLAGQEVAGRTA